jgi:hypothetical protein
MEGSKLPTRALKLPFVIDKATARPRFFMRANYDGQIMNLKRPGSNPAGRRGDLARPAARFFLKLIPSRWMKFQTVP